MQDMYMDQLIWFILMLSPGVKENMLDDVNALSLTSNTVLSFLGQLICFIAWCQHQTQMGRTFARCQRTELVFYVWCQFQVLDAKQISWTSGLDIKLKNQLSWPIHTNTSGVKTQDRRLKSRSPITEKNKYPLIDILSGWWFEPFVCYILEKANWNLANIRW